MTKKKSSPTQPLKIPKFILLSVKVCAALSTKLLTLYTAKLFTTPIKHKVPKRELDMDEKSIQTTLSIPQLNSNVVVYEYGHGAKKVLLVHGWSGRGTQLFKIAEALVNKGYAVVSFDAPAHGKSEGTTAIMNGFIYTALAIQKKYGPFEVAIGHSLGGMTVLNAIKMGLIVEKAIVIGSGDIVQDILDDFIAKLKLQPKNGIFLRNHFEEKYQIKMNDYSAFKAAQDITIPTLVIHDIDDPEVPVKAGNHIYHHLQNGELYLTEGLGHRKILGNQGVIKKIIEFMQ